MRRGIWKRIPEIEDERKLDEMEIGDYFLYGTNLIAQKQNKKVGQQISYFQIIDKKQKGHVEYAPIFDILETDLDSDGKENTQGE